MAESTRCPISCFLDQRSTSGLAPAGESAMARSNGSSFATMRRKRSGKSFTPYSRTRKTGAIPNRRMLSTTASSTAGAGATRPVQPFHLVDQKPAHRHHGGSSAHERNTVLDGSHAAGCLDADRRPYRLPDQRDVVHRGAAGAETGAGLDEARAAIQNQLGGGDFLGLGQDTGFNDDLERDLERARHGHHLADVLRDARMVARLERGDVHDHVQVGRAAPESLFGLQALDAGGCAAARESNRDLRPYARTLQFVHEDAQVLREGDYRTKAVFPGRNARGARILFTGRDGKRFRVVDHRHKAGNLVRCDFVHTLRSYSDAKKGTGSSPPRPQAVVRTATTARSHPWAWQSMRNCSGPRRRNGALSSHDFRAHARPFPSECGGREAARVAAGRPHASR